MASKKLIINLLNMRISDPEAKIKVAYSLKKLKNKIPGDIQERVAEKLLRFSNDRDVKVRYVSVSALQGLYGNVSDKEREKINKRLCDLCADRNPWVLFNVREFIKKINFEDKVAEKILEMSKSSYPKRRYKAVVIFRNTRTLLPGDKVNDVVEAISKLCSDEQLIVRIAAVREIRHAGVVIDNTQEKINNALLRSCTDSNWIVRYGAVRTICAQRDKFHGSIIIKILEILLNLCSYEKWEVRFSAVQSLGRMRHIIPFDARDKIIVKVSQTSETDINKTVKASAKSALEKLHKI